MKFDEVKIKCLAGADKIMDKREIVAYLLEQLYWAEDINFDDRGNPYCSHSGDYLDNNIESEEDE